MTSDKTQDFSATQITHLISGIVTGASGVTVTLSGDKEETQTVDTDGGKYEFEVPEGGDYTVTPSKTGYTFTPVNCSFSDVSSDKSQDFIALLEIAMISIPAGSFYMGSNEGDYREKPVHKVTLDAFEMSATEVTRGQYYTIMDQPYVGDLNLPIDQINWYDAVSFCNRLSDVIGFDQCYDEITLDCDFLKNGFRLPTEAEWEYACRAGTTTKYYTGNLESDLARAGWYDGNSNQNCHPVGQKIPNAYGLYDMHGNLSEWCNDWFDGDYYSVSPERNPIGQEYGVRRAIRGGNYYFSATNCRATFRDQSSTEIKVVNNGFRVARGSFTPGYTISGTVSGADGVTVALSGDKTESQAVNDGGSYSFTVEHGGSYTVTPSKDGYTFTTISIQFTNVTSNITQNFTASQITYTISGTVTGADGITVTLSGDASGSRTVNHGSTYSFTVAGGGSYTVTPTKFGHMFTPSSRTFTNISSDQSLDFKCILFEDDFINNNNDWVEKDTEDVRLEVVGGKYVLEHKREGSSWILIKYFLLDFSGDFTIETTLTHESGVTNYGYGLVFGAVDLSNYYYFRISGGGYYSYSKRENGAYIVTIDSKKSDYINTGDATNELSVVRSGSQLKLYINDNLVEQVSFEPFFGSKVGYKVDNVQTIGVEDITIRVEY